MNRSSRRSFLQDVTTGMLVAAASPLASELGWSAAFADEDRPHDQPEIKPRRIIELNEGPLRGVAFSMDGRTVAAAGDRVHLIDVKAGERSEEHTSELQSHSEISYAVFCLKKKKK